MLNKLKNLFSKGDNDINSYVPANQGGVFHLFFDDLEIGQLKCENEEWVFKYSENFKHYKADYKYIPGFPQLDKEYRSNTLWPFFRIRIPGLDQPAIKEILEEEKIEKENEFALLKRFGKFSISNPYKLLLE